MRRKRVLGLLLSVALVTGCSSDDSDREEAGSTTSTSTTTSSTTTTTTTTTAPSTTTTTAPELSNEAKTEALVCIQNLGEYAGQLILLSFVDQAEFDEKKAQCDRAQALLDVESPELGNTQGNRIGVLLAHAMLDTQTWHTEVLISGKATSPSQSGEPPDELIGFTWEEELQAELRR